MQNEIKHGRMEHGWKTESLSRGCGSGENEDTGTDDGADAERGQAPWTQRAMQPLARLIAGGDESIDVLGPK